MREKEDHLLVKSLRAASFKRMSDNYRKTYGKRNEYEP